MRCRCRLGRRPRTSASCHGGEGLPDALGACAVRRLGKDLDRAAENVPGHLTLSAFGLPRTQTEKPFAADEFLAGDVSSWLDLNRHSREVERTGRGCVRDPLGLEP